MRAIRPSFTGLLGLMLLLTPSIAWADKNGIASNQFDSSGCNQCHWGGPSPDVNLSGPAVVLGGKTGTFVVDVKGDGFHKKTGMNVSSPSGTFSLAQDANSAQTKLILNSSTNRNEVTHSSSKDTNGSDHAYFSFNWQAPTGACTTVTLTAWGLSADGWSNATGDKGSKSTFTVSNCLDNGAVCSANSDCKSGFCTDGVCCNEACGGNTPDCRTCRQSEGAPSDGVCGTTFNNIVCRPSAGPCDAEEVCNGVATTCPADQKYKDTLCRIAAGPCDMEEFCDGTSVQCPADTKMASGTLCRPQADLCDKADTCNGTSIDCPDERLALGAVCRPAAGDCDLPETCDAGGLCPWDQVQPNSVICRATNGACDAAEKCDGSSVSCPTDAKLPKNTVCRTANGACDASEVCDGTSGDCPVDAKLPKGSVCRAANGACDVQETCDGAGNNCPVDAKSPKDTVCRISSGSCDVAEKCDGTSAQCPTDTVLPSSTVCRTSDGPCDQAETCDGSTGQCPSDSFQAAGTVCRAKNGACDVAEMCNGVSAQCPTDQFASSSISCRNPSCTGETETKGASCPGNSPNCPAPVTKNCNPFICGINACKSNCSSSADCAIGSVCVAGSCQPLLESGQACTSGEQCKSNYCVDGVCCSTACNGQCEACDVAGKVGSCSPVSGAPHGKREACATDGSLCGGSCDGIHPLACAYPAAETSCRDASCANSQATLAASCNGKGACPVVQTQPCGAQGCDTTQCKGDCVSNSGCDTNSYCSAGICKPKFSNGAVCSTDDRCLSGYCVDGVCCSDACDGQCEACDITGKVGICSPVSGKPRGGRTACVTDGSLCGGICNGIDPDACAYPAAEAKCRDAVCFGNQALLAAACDGKGACPASQSKNCTPYGCNGTQCGGGCTVDSDCISGYFCEAGACALKKQQGESCSNSGDCSTGFCADGVCCDKACKGQCEACNAPGKEGVCLPVTGDPQNGRTACAGEGSCKGTCNGAVGNSCTFPGANTSCREASCKDGIATLPAFCDSQGSCPTEKTQACAPFSCGADQCAGDCQVDSDCLNGTFCSAGVCASKKVLGDTCTDDSECGSNHCADGVCCSSSCDGQCQSCNLPATKGTCSVLLNAQPAPGKPACVGEGECQGYCDGSSPTECFFPTKKKICSAATCEDNLYTKAAYCDGIGSCDIPTTSNCGAYSCGPGGCKVTCTSHKDCAEGFECNSNHTCKPIPGGEAGAGGVGGEGGEGGEAGAGGQEEAGQSGASGKGGSTPKGGTGGSTTTGGKGGVGGSGGTKADLSVEDADAGTDGGCGCRMVKTASPISADLALAGVGIVAMLRRRRRK